MGQICYLQYVTIFIIRELSTITVGVGLKCSMMVEMFTAPIEFENKIALFLLLHVSDFMTQC